MTRTLLVKAEKLKIYFNEKTNTHFIKDENMDSQDSIDAIVNA
jgi:hypothetical protein